MSFGSGHEDTVSVSHLITSHDRAYSSNISTEKTHFPYLEAEVERRNADKLRIDCWIWSENGLKRGRGPLVSSFESYVVLLHQCVSLIAYTKALPCTLKLSRDWFFYSFVMLFS